jgi:hypothetical protein
MSLKDFKSNKSSMWALVSFLILIIAVYYGMSFLFHAILGEGAKNMEHYQDVGNFISSTAGIAVSFAGSLVAIVLALSALSISKRQEFSDIKQQILERVQETRDITQNIVTAYKEVEFLAYDFVTPLMDPEKLVYINKKYKKMQIVQKKLSEYNSDNLEEYETASRQLEILNEQLKNLLPLESLNEVMNNFADALLKMETNLFCSRAYQYGFKYNEKFDKLEYIKPPKTKDECYYTANKVKVDDSYVKVDNFYIDAKQTTELAIQIKKYTKDFTGEYLLNLISHINQKVPYLNDPETQKDLLIGIFLGYLTAPFQQDDKKLSLLGALTFYDILCNLPSADDMIKVAEKREEHNIKESSKIKNKLEEAIKNTLGISDSNSSPCDFKAQVEETRKLLKKNFDKILVYKKATSKDILLLAKWIANAEGAEKITLGHVQKASVNFEITDDELNKLLATDEDFEQLESIDEKIKVAQGIEKKLYEESFKESELYKWLNANHEKYIGTIK